MCSPAVTGSASAGTPLSATPAPPARPGDRAIAVKLVPAMTIGLVS
jgi:hypothetical protein